MKRFLRPGTLLAALAAAGTLAAICAVTGMPWQIIVLAALYPAFFVLLGLSRQVIQQAFDLSSTGREQYVDEGRLHRAFFCMYFCIWAIMLLPCFLPGTTAMLVVGLPVTLIMWMRIVSLGRIRAQLYPQSGNAGYYVLHVAVTILIFAGALFLKNF